MSRIFGTMRKRREETAPHPLSTPVSLPPIDNISVRLSAVSLVTRSARNVPTQLAPVVQQDRKSSLVDVSENMVIVSVRDTVRALPVFEIIAEWQVQVTFVNPVDKAEFATGNNWQWLIQHANPYTAELVAHLTMRSGFVPVVLSLVG